jgi:hypothetical protein
MKTATSVLATVPAQARLPRKWSGQGLAQLVCLQDFSTDFTVKLLALGVTWADDTGRTTGTLSMALRKATPWQAAQLVAAMAKAGLRLQSQVPAWLNQNALAILA